MNNMNPTTGVRYTVYAMNNLNPDLWDDIYRGTNLTEREYLRSHADNVARTLLDLPDEILEHLNVECMRDEIMTTAVDNGLLDNVTFDEPVYEGETDGIQWRLSWLGGAPMLWVLESPYFGIGDVCSPCVPNALNGDSVTAVFNDEVVASANATANNLAVGYAVPPSWRAD